MEIIGSHILLYLIQPLMNFNEILENYPNN